MRLRAFEDKVRDRRAVIGVIGLGYVGLPTAVNYANHGFKVLGLDVDLGRVAGVNEGRSYITDVTDQQLAALVTPSGDGAAQLSATSEYAGLSACDAVFICVPTPFDEHKTPDSSYIVQAGKQLSQTLRREQLVILESTTWPGTTEELLRPILEGSGLKAGIDFHLAYAPERIDPGNKKWTEENTPRVLGGVSSDCARAAAVLMEAVSPAPYVVSSCKAAEMTKLMENTFRAVNIAYANEMALLAEGLGLDIWEIIAAASTKPFGYMPFYPGPGVGGHCIPVQPHYIAWTARGQGVPVPLTQLAAQVNEHMPTHAFDLIRRALGQRGKGMRGARVLVLGAAFKPEVGDVRNAPALEVLSALLAEGAIAQYHDPYVPEVHVRTAHHGPARKLRSVELSVDVVAEQDCVAILVGHRLVDHGLIQKHAQLIVDAVGLTSKTSLTNVVRLGNGNGHAHL